MASNSIRAKTKNHNGEFTIEHHQTDAHVFHVDQMEKLHHFRPDLVDEWVRGIEKEAEYRRKTKNKVNHFIFIEKILGQVFGMLIGLVGTIAGSYVALKGQPIAGASIASIAIGSLAVAFVRSQKK